MEIQFKYQNEKTPLQIYQTMLLTSVIGKCPDILMIMINSILI